MIRFAENLNKMIAAGLGGPLDPPRTEVAVGHRIVYTEASGAVVNFETNLIAPVKNLRVTMNPIQSGTGDPSPDNIRPISGHESVTAERTGRNLFDFTEFARQYPDVCVYDQSTGELSVSSINYLYDTGVAFDVNLNGGGYVSAEVKCETASNVRIRVVFSDGTLSETAGASDTSAFVRVYNWLPKKRITSIRFNWSTNGTFTLRNIYITNIATDTDYEPYDGQSATIQLGQIVYGGTLDVSTGKLTVTHGEIASYNGEVLTGEWMSDRDVYAAGTTPTIGAQVVYVLDTPQTIDLDPQQITTLKGTNNMWSNSGDVTLEYPYYEETEGY